MKSQQGCAVGGVGFAHCDAHVCAMVKKLDSAEVAADKAKAMKEYRAGQIAAVGRIAALREARLAREAHMAREADIKAVAAPAAKRKAKAS